MRIRTFALTQESNQIGKVWLNRSPKHTPTTQANSPYWTFSNETLTWEMLDRMMHVLQMDVFVGGIWQPVIHRGHVVVENARKFVK